MSLEMRPVPRVVPSRAGTGTRNGRATTALFALTSFTGAALLFVVQPMVARLVLPSFGGSASVWSTSSLFFQVLLLLGYLYVHVSTQRLGRTRQPVLHLGILLLPLVALPVALPPEAAPDGGVSPTLWLLWVLLLVIGLPFAVISTTGPLLQRWYSWTPSARAEDPYFLFATSNLGSFGGLLAYPFVVEPLLTLREQRLGWSGGFVVFIVLMGLCGVVARRSQRAGPVAGSAVPVPDEHQSQADLDAGTPDDEAGARLLTARLVLVWLALAFLPSTLMLGVTAHISTDVAAIPLMWVVPLAIYLATFVVAFARSSRRAHPGPTHLAAGLATVAALVHLTSARSLPIWALLVLDLALLGSAAYAAHRALAIRRPDPRLLTHFYLVVAGGGALGGLLNGLVAPLFFSRVWEYPLALLGVLLLGRTLPRPPARSGWGRDRFDPRVVRALEVVLVVLVVLLGAAWGTTWLAQGGLLTLGGVALWAALGMLGGRRSTSMAAALALTMAGLFLLVEEPLHQSRTFYGSYQVLADGDQHLFSHGTTVHGTQFTDERSTEPTSYYARQGPVGDVFGLGAPEHTGVVGLGVGTMAAHVGSGQRMTFVEIDEEVVRIASDPSLFTFLAQTEATVETVVDDGRIAVAGMPTGSLDTLVMDAFSSDAIPVHLLTEEAFEVYERALADDGVLLVHISNRVFDLEPVVAHNAEHLGWDVAVGTGELEEGSALPSVWMALSPDPEPVERLLEMARWRRAGTARQPWTDDFSSVLTVLQ